MATFIQIGTTKDEPKKVEKAITLGNSIECSVKEPCDLFKPTFYLRYSDSYRGANYLYCPTWKKYYFINDIIPQPGHLCQIVCTEDVLMTFKDQIYAQEVIVDRADGVWDAYLPDELDKFKGYTRTTAMTFKSANLPVVLNYDVSHPILIAVG